MTFAQMAASFVPKLMTSVDKVVAGAEVTKTWKVVDMSILTKVPYLEVTSVVGDMYSKFLFLKYQSLPISYSFLALEMLYS